jgi:hypothetical protein
MPSADILYRISNGKFLEEEVPPTHILNIFTPLNVLTNSGYWTDFDLILCYNPNSGELFCLINPINPSQIFRSKQQIAFLPTAFLNSQCVLILISERYSDLISIFRIIKIIIPRDDFTDIHSQTSLNILKKLTIGIQERNQL